MAEYRDNIAVVGRVPGAFASDVPTSDGAASRSGVSWGAIFAGAAAAASLSLVLLLLGAGLGLTTVSPWASQGAGAAAVGIAAILWLTFTQIAASGMGGYLAGRLRTKWSGAHTDEVYFRDTAHGFLSWAVATLLTAALLTSVVGSIVGTGAQAGASMIGGAATAATAVGAGAAGAAGSSGASDASSSGALGYFTDSLFRKDAGAPTAAPTDATAAPTPPPAVAASSSMSDRDTAASTAEVTRIFVNSIRTGALPAEDSKYVAQVIAQRTGLGQQEAEKRVQDTYAKAQAALKAAETKAREAADTARKTTAYASLWLVVSMLIGAFVASFAATYGGRRRDL